MPAFIERTAAPAASDSHYYSANPFYVSGYGMPNCTAYAWGRFYELSGSRPNLSLSDAERWYSYSDGYQRGQVPRLGAVICWRAGSPSDDSDGSGHVAIVERINSDGSIVTSNSAWNSTLFYRETLYPPNYYMGASYTFQGFIYNPVNFDGGTVTYEFISGNRYLNQTEMDNNARAVYQYFINKGWTLNAIAALCGNMSRESTINPGLWESMVEYGDGNGFGLVQWTPWTKLHNWAGERSIDPSSGIAQCDRIIYEMENGLQWIATSAYPMTFQQFAQSTSDAGTLAVAFMMNYERPGVPATEERIQWGQYYYELLSHEQPPGPQPTSRKRARFPWVLYANKIRNRR